MTAKKLLPFDLEKALAGYPVVNGSEEKVDEIHLFKTDTSMQPLCAVINGEPFWVNKEGKQSTNMKYNLFMLAKTKTYYANVYEAINDPIVFVSKTFMTLESAKDNITEVLNEDCSYVQTKFIKTISFEVDDV